nr:hypothetical protein [Actinomycetota bacterium]
MGFLDRLLGREPIQNQGAGGYAPTNRSFAPGPAGAQPSAGPQDSTTGATAEDRQAIARYRYLLRTAPPEQIEQAHAQAFEQLNPSQRQQVLREMTQTLPAGEQPQSDDPRQLARAATRAEMQQPGYLQRTFGGRGYGGMGGGMMGGGMMGGFGGSLLGSVAGVVIGTAVADSLMGGFDGSPEHQEAYADDGNGGDQGSGDQGSGDQGSGDQGGGADQAGFDSAGGNAGWGGDQGGGGGGGD